ncbi:MAG: Copper-transporting P-type ATPase [Candidatus Udaeobacter sp.]|nr:MAG: Copper-transporting P-type ATPase [Candidatus Udaeobacter sp.]
MRWDWQRRCRSWSALDAQRKLESWLKTRSDRSHGKVTHLLTDKTGTLTAGKPEVINRIVANTVSERDLLQIAASVESQSEHPLARAIVESAKQEKIELRDVTDFQSVTGGGVSGKVEGKAILVGKEKFLADSNVRFPEELTEEARHLQEKAETTVWLAVNGDAAGVLGIADPIKPTTKEAVRELHAMDLKIIMCTGDNLRTAESVARDLGIDEFKAEVMPEKRSKSLKTLNPKAQLLPWLGTGSTTRQHLQRRMSELRWGQGPT